MKVRYLLSKVADNSDKKKLLKNFMALSVLRGFEFIVPIITLPYLIRVLGIETYGLISFALAFSLYFGFLIQYGFSLTATREIARNQDDLVAVSLIYINTLWSSIYLSLFCFLVLVVIIFNVSFFAADYQLYLLTFLYVAFQNIFPIWFFQGMEKMKYIAYINVLTKLVFLIGLFVFVTEEVDYIYVPLMQLVMAFLNVLFAVYIIRSQFKIGFGLANFFAVKKVLYDNFSVFSSQIMPSIFNNTLPFVLGLFANNSVVGMYTAAVRIVDAVNSIGFIISNTFLPHLTNDMLKFDVFKKIMLSISFFLSLAVFVLADVIEGLVLGASDSDLGYYLQYLSVNVMLTFSILIFSTNYLLIMNKDYLVRNVAVSCSSLFLVASFVFVPIYGIWSALTLLMGLKFSIAMISFYYYKKHKAKCGVL